MQCGSDLSDVVWFRSAKTIDNPSKYNCVEFGTVGDDGTVAVRNSNHPERGALLFTADEWSAFEAGFRGAGFRSV